MPKFKATYRKSNGVRLVDRYTADNLDQALEAAYTYSKERDAKVVSVEDTGL